MAKPRETKTKHSNNLAEDAKSNPAKFGELYDIYVEQIYSFFFHRTNGNQANAEDLTSFTFEKVLRNISKFDSQKANFSTWIYSIAQNNLTDFYRKQKFRDGISLDSTSSSSQDSDSKSPSLSEKLTDSNSNDDSYVMKDRNQKILNLALSRLPEKDQTVLSLKYIQGLTYEETATIVGCSANAVGVRISRALKKLMIILKKQNLIEKIDF